MRRTVLLKIAGVAVAALIGLTGCAGGGESDDTTAEQPATSDAPASSPAAPSSSAPADPEPSESESAPAESEDPGQGDSGDSGTPTQEEVAAGVAKYFGEQGLPEDKAKKFGECLAKEMYDKSKPKTLKALADAEPTKMDPSDAALFSKSSSTCTSAVR